MSDWIVSFQIPIEVGCVEDEQGMSGENTKIIGARRIGSVKHGELDTAEALVPLIIRMVP